MTKISAQLVDIVKQQCSLVEEISTVISLKRRGPNFWGLCPFHHENTSSFCVSEARGFYYCFGCGAHGDVIEFVRAHYGFSFRDALAYLSTKGRTENQNSGYVKRKNSFPDKNNYAEKKAWVRSLWRHSVSVASTKASTYLEARSIRIKPPASIRFSPRCYHQESTKYWPAMICAVQQSNGELSGVHRTFLDQDGLKKAPVLPTKKMAGVCYGGAVRLTAAGAVLAIAEGIENGLSVLQSIPNLPVWAALSLDNMSRIELPANTKTVILLADSDTKDLNMGKRQMMKAARHYRDSGAQVRIAWPPAGTDFNDLLGSDLGESNNEFIDNSYI